jgi:putative transposase
MKKLGFSEQQIAFILRQAEEGTPVEEVCRKAGISEATYYAWRKKYGGLIPSEMKRLKQLEEESQRRLKKVVVSARMPARSPANSISKWSSSGTRRTSSIKLQQRRERPGVSLRSPLPCPAPERWRRLPCWRG